MIEEAIIRNYGADNENKITQVMLSENWYRENMLRVKARFEDKTISIPKDADILHDLRALKVIKGVIEYDY